MNESVFPLFVSNHLQGDLFYPETGVNTKYEVNVH